MHIPVIFSERLELRPLDTSSVDTVITWLRDPAVNRFMLSGHEPIERADELCWYQQMLASETELVLQIHRREDGRHVGNIGLHHIDTKHRGAELGIMIGETAEWGRGYGRESMIALLGYAFGELGLHRVVLRCHPGNDRGVAAYRAVGFTEVGHERQAVFIEGEWQDHLVFDMLEDEFRARHAGE